MVGALRWVGAIFVLVSIVLPGAYAQSTVTPIAAEVPLPSLKPPAPPSPWITARDEDLLRGVFESLGRRNYAEAQALRRSVADPMARSVADWAYLRSRAKDISMPEVQRFLDRHYGWPNETLIQSRIEADMDDLAASAEEVLSFFDQRDPVTGDGHLQLARAFFALGNEDAARNQLRIAWVDFDWSASEERQILRDYGRYLNEDDHWAKADRQLFEIKATATQRLLNLLGRTRRDEAQVRIGFLKLDRNAIKLYERLPRTSSLDSGVLHAATRYYRRTDKEDQAVIYASLAPLDRDALRAPEAWHYERRLLTRWAMKTGRFDDAYTLSAYSGLEEGAKFAEAEFMAGWISLRFLNDAERAKAHFAFLSTGVTAPISRARGEYWLARAWEATGDAENARQHYRVAAAYPFTYYGQLAIEALGPEAPQVPFPEDPEIDAAALAVFESRPLVHAMRILAELDEDLHYDRFARALDDQIESEGEVAAYFDLVLDERKFYLAVRAGKVARNNGADVPAVVYPVIPVPDSARAFVEEPLILGLSRQESEFNPRAYSRARARGLMQMLDSTARITARKEGMPYSVNWLMDDPRYNLTLGAAHLSHLLERFDGSYIMVLAAYNAGPHRVDQWVETYGDPRDPRVDPIDWIELIPFSETRNYVMRVLENTQVYRARLEERPLGGLLTADLIRGGNTTEAFGVVPPVPALFEVALVDGGGPNIITNKPKLAPLALQRFPELRFPPITDAATNVPQPRREDDIDTEFVGSADSGDSF